ncbi:hypothetical protein BD779DRAFT_1486579 [Infundibulicybe gibba]|nr:hypothetical protein BD779DRAFT_1486579 [Infundibulicybe gibba]
MNRGRRSYQFSSTFAWHNPAEFFSKLLELDVDREYLQNSVNNVSSDALLHDLKPSLNMLFRMCLTHARTTPYDDIKRANALTTFTALTLSVLGKNLSGWEIMEVMAGGVHQSDEFFTVCIRHQVLQLALTFMCGVTQLSPGAYFLRRDLFPSIIIFIKSPDTQRYTFEAILLLAILANFHKSDAAKLNPYLQRIRDTRDEDLMRKICWASNFALDAAIKTYQQISDDSVSPTLSKTLGSMIASWRPDRALASTQVDPPRELFKNHSRLPPPPCTLLSLSSYLLTHAGSTASLRSTAYANLSLNILLLLAEDDKIMSVLSKSSTSNIRLCRQRLPPLPIPKSGRAPTCALLDCCILWLRHNLQKQLDAHAYTICIWICHRVIWYLQRERIRLDYEWIELWISIIGLLKFLTTKLDSLTTTGGVERLVRETVLLLDLCLFGTETYLPTPQSIHEFVVRRQTSLLNSLGTNAEQKLSEAGTRTAKEAMGIVAREIEVNGLQAGRPSHEIEPL